MGPAKRQGEVVFWQSLLDQYEHMKFKRFPLKYEDYIQCSLYKHEFGKIGEMKILVFAHMLYEF